MFSRLLSLFRGTPVAAWLRPSIGRLHCYAPRELSFPRHEKPNTPGFPLPTITVVVPSFNQAAYIVDTLNSLLKEGYPSLELIVVDGGSDDGTVDILKAYSDKLEWWVSEPDGGQADAINKGFKRSTGQIMAWLNSDDQIVPGTLHKVAELFAVHASVDVLYGNRIVIDADGREIARWILPYHSNDVTKRVDFVPQETLFWRRRAWDAVGSSLDQSFRFAMDWDLIVRFINAGLKIRHFSVYMGIFRVHDAQKTSSVIDTIGKNEIELIRFRELGTNPSETNVLMYIAWYLLAAKAVELSMRALDVIKIR